MHPSTRAAHATIRTRQESFVEPNVFVNQAIERMFASAEIHRRQHDPTLFDSGLEPILRKVVAAVIDQETIIVNWKSSAAKREKTEPRLALCIAIHVNSCRAVEFCAALGGSASPNRW